MSRLRICLLLAVICSCSCLGQAGPPKEDTIDVKPTTEPSTAAPESKSHKTTTSTTPSTTTTSTTTPSTTSSTTTTTPSTTSSTTTTTSTTPAPTTPAPSPPTPTPVPPPELGTWTVNDTKTNVTCIVAQFAAQVNVSYSKKNASSNVTDFTYVILNVPANASYSGNCSGDQQLTLTWQTANATVDNTLVVTYHKNDTTKTYGVKSLNMTLAPELFTDRPPVPIELYYGVEWQTPLATSYRCKQATTLNMSSDSAPGNIMGKLTLSQLQEEAYRTTAGSGFSAARECGGGDVPDAVPIAVGCALGGLVVVVLIAYLVGRRRSAARGYLSM